MFNWKLALLLLGCYTLSQSATASNNFIHLFLSSALSTDNKFNYNLPDNINVDVHPNYNYFPFAKRNFSFLVKGDGHLKISISLYPINSPTLPNYKIFITQDQIMIFKDDDINGTSYNEISGISAEYKQYEIAVVPSKVATSLIVACIGGSNTTLNVTWPFDLPHIGFGAITGDLNMMVDTATIVNNIPK